MKGCSDRILSVYKKDRLVNYIFSPYKNQHCHIAAAIIYGIKLAPACEVRYYTLDTSIPMSDFNHIVDLNDVGVTHTIINGWIHFSLGHLN